MLIPYFSASPTLEQLHDKLNNLYREKVSLAAHLQIRFGRSSISLPALRIADEGWQDQQV